MASSRASAIGRTWVSIDCWRAATSKKPTSMPDAATDMIKPAMERSLQEGMQTFDQSLFKLYREGRIELDEALNKADSRDGLALRIRLAEGGTTQESELPAETDDTYGTNY